MDVGRQDDRLPATQRLRPHHQPVQVHEVAIRLPDLDVDHVLTGGRDGVHRPVAHRVEDHRPAVAPPVPHQRGRLVDERREDASQIDALASRILSDLGRAVLVDMDAIEGGFTEHAGEFAQQVRVPGRAWAGIHDIQEAIRKLERFPGRLEQRPIRVCPVEGRGRTVDRRVGHGGDIARVGRLNQAFDGRQRHAPPQQVRVGIAGGQQGLVPVLPVVELQAVDMVPRRPRHSGSGVVAPRLEFAQKPVARRLRPTRQHVERGRCGRQRPVAVEQAHGDAVTARHVRRRGPAQDR